MARTAEGPFRDQADLFGAMMSGPVVVIFALVAVLLSCLPLHHAVQRRHVANTRTRISARQLVGRHLMRAAAGAWVIFFLHGFVAFAAWPRFGNPSIDPLGYGLTPAEAAVDAAARSSYGFLLEGGDLAFGLGYSAWLGAAAAAYGGLGACLLLLLPQRLLALALPFLIYLGGSIAAAVAAEPHLGLMESLFPFGLTAAHPAVSAAPTIVVIFTTIAMSAIVVHRAPTNPRLS